jgi:hypothetical protein
MDCQRSGTLTFSTSFVLALLGVVAACGGEPNYMTREELLDPESCRDCHPQHYKEWKSSMHAYAAEDPVFRAMNQRGQEETGGELGDFCVQCHAPMAVREGFTSDGTDLDEVPEHLRGVTCYFCHSVVDVQAPPHNNPLVLADDLVLRGGLGAEAPPVENGAHRMKYSALHDRRSKRSSELCGACHDIVTPAGVHLERTFAEWQESIFGSDDPLARLSCGQCHMKGDIPGVVADVPDVPLRFPHEHTWPGIDVAMTAWPDVDLQTAQIQRELGPALNPKLCVRPDGQIEYNLDNVGAGHEFPSGASADRRAWVELVAYSGTTVVFQTGVVGAGEAVTKVAETDANLWQIRDFGLDNAGQPAHMFWDVRDVVRATLPPAVTLDRNDPAFNHSVSRFFSLQGQVADRVTAVAYIRPLGLDLVDDLIASGHLEASLRDQVVTHTIEGTRLEWTINGVGFGCVCRNGPC